jgi:hypothetical protein
MPVDLHNTTINKDGEMGKREAMRQAGEKFK